MTPDLVALLCSRYPRIFPAGRLPPRSGVGNGWFAVIDGLCEGLQDVTDRGGPQVVAEQVVESFGVLHFDPHLTAVNDEQKGMIVQAIAMSARTCEICGAPGLLIRIRRGGCRTRCAIHEAWRSDEPVPVFYVYVDSETGRMTGQLVDRGRPGTVLSADTFAGLMARTVDERQKDVQVVQLRDIRELPTECVV